MRQKAKAFVCVADEMYSLHTGSGPEAEFFQALARRGHAGGRQGVSQQGYYCFTPSGQLLASDNSRDPERIGRLLDVGLARWQALSREQRLLPQTPPADPRGRYRSEAHYPADGLVLRQYTRDLGATRRILGDMENPWNTDMVWFSAAEVRQLAPPGVGKGDRYKVPEYLVARLARLHLLDSALGQAIPFQARSISAAGLQMEVVDIRDNRVHLKMTGETRASEGGRTMDLRLRGQAVYDQKSRRMASFELYATGTRTGRRLQPYIRNETGKGEIGFAFILAGDSRQDRVAPSLFPAYGWR